MFLFVDDAFGDSTNGIAGMPKQQPVTDRKVDAQMRFQVIGKAAKRRGNGLAVVLVERAKKARRTFV